MLPLRALRVFRVWSANWNHVSALEPCYCQGCADLGGLCCHQDPGGIGTRAAVRAMSRSVVLLQLGSVGMPMASVSTNVINLSCPLLENATGKLAQTLREEVDNTPHHRRALPLGSTLELTL